MLVSGGRVIAIDSVKTGNTLKGDGVFNTPGSKLDVNTDIIATKEFVTTEDEKVVGKINAASATLSSKIDSVSSKLTTSAETLSANKQDKLTFGYNNYNEITAINTSALAGGNKVKIESTNSSVSITATTAQDTGLVTYDLSVSSETIINPTDVKAENGLTAATAVNGDKTTFTLGIKSDYLNGVKNDIESLSSNKADKNSVYLKTETSSKNQLTTEFAKYQPKGNYYSANNPSAFINKTSGDLYYQPKGNYLSSNALDEIANASGNWNTTYTNVNTSSKYWNSAYDTIYSISALKDIGNFKEIDIYKDGVHEPLRIIANGSADKLELKEVANINFIANPLDGSIQVSAKDTTYSQGQYIKISGNTNEINVTGLQPVGNYVSSTEFETYKTSAANELAKKQDKSAMSAYAESAWVVDNFLSANALDDIKNLSAKWDAASDEVTSHSANWNSVYETVQTNSGDWEEITKVKTFKTIGGIDATTSADSLEFSAGENIKIGINEGKIFVSSHDTTYDENDFISASHLDNIVSVSSTVTSNSADWTSAARALEASADKWNTTHEQFNTSSVKWNELYDEYQVSSKLWNDTTDIVNTFSGDWNEVSAKANSADLKELSGKVETLSGELENASATLSDEIDILSGVIDNISAVFSADIDYISGDVEKKLYTEDFETWSAQTTAWDVTPYSAGKGLALNGHEFYVSADYAMSADVYNKDEIDEKFANFGGYTTANADTSGYPDVAKPSTKYIYLVKMSNLPASSDNYKEWIYTSADAQTTAWECVGETTMDLTPYLTKEEAANTYQPIGDYVVSSTDVIKPGSAWVLVNDDNHIQWSGLDVSELGKKYIVKSSNGSVKVGSATVGNVVTYDLSADNIPTISSEYMLSNYNSATNKYELSGATIVGENGVSAKYNPATNEWNVGLENNNLVAYGRYTTNQNSYTTSAAIDNFVQEDSIGTDIYLNNGKIYLNSGFYHVDLQVNVNVPGNDNNYYTATVKSTTAPLRQMIQDIDASYSHSEMLDLSYDIRITSDDTLLEFTIENLPTGATYNVHNLDIHRIIYSISEIEGATTYTAGGGILIDQNDNNSINVNTGKGLTINKGDNTLQVKLGEGLTFSTSGDINAIVINKEVEDVVETVEKLAEDLDTKVTTNMAIADIATIHPGTDYFNSISFGNNHGQDSCGMLNQLFSIPINNKLYVDDGVTKHVTHVGIYTDHSFNSNYGVIFSLYEYNFDGNNGSGDTEWLCDTGAVKWNAGGRNEFPIIHMRENAELRADRMYYASVCVDGTEVNNLYLAGTSTGYAPTVNSTPKLTFGVSNIGLSLNNPNESTSGLHGFSYDESCHGNPRFFIQIRNKKVR